ncbi:MAG: lipopolysaccharide heptosyltransferase II [Planctomycetia bacterium]|nr:lipopolysaccharide heptosyltransferase II [Planctomycetia bacterium]
MRLGIFLPNWIGDVVMATPTLRALRRMLGPEGRMVGVMRPYVAQVLAGTPWLDGELYYDPRSKHAELHSRALVQKLRAEQLDAVVLLTNSLRTGVLARLSGARRRVGYARALRGPLLTDKLTPLYAGRTWYGARRYTPAPVLDYYLELAYALGCPPESPRLELAVSPADRAAAERTWQTLGLPRDRPTIVFNSGGAYGAAKVWPNEYFAELARRLVARTDASVLMLCGPAEREVARDVVAQANHPRVTSLADDTLADQPLSIGLSKACVERSRLMVTTDSGPRHFAAAFGVPVVSLFGPTHIEWSENHQAEAVHIQKKLPCGPCQSRVCPLGTHQCMRDLSVDEVEKATLRMLAKYPASQVHSLSA